MLKYGGIHYPLSDRPRLGPRLGPRQDLGEIDSGVVDTATCQVLTAGRRQGPRGPRFHGERGCGENLRGVWGMALTSLALWLDVLEPTTVLLHTLWPKPSSTRWEGEVSAVQCGMEYMITLGG
jgi:hypothetical protein